MDRVSKLQLVDEVCHSTNLAGAFSRYRRYRGLWTCGTPMTEVAANPVAPMLALAETLRADYRPLPPKTLQIAKGDGSMRELKVYVIRDRVAQRAALQVLQAKTDAAMAAGSFGFRPGRGVAQALAATRAWIDRGYVWAVDADVERCFDSIPHKGLLEAVALRAGQDAAELVARLMGWGAGASGVGIPQGAPLSPWLCNVYLWSLDEVLMKESVPMTRYADDFVALSPCEAMAHRALEICRETLSRLRLRLHPEKTRLLRADTPFRFLGQWLGATPLLAAPLALAGEVSCC